MPVIQDARLVRNEKYIQYYFECEGRYASVFGIGMLFWDGDGVITVSETDKGLGVVPMVKRVDIAVAWLQGKFNHTDVDAWLMAYSCHYPYSVFRPALHYAADSETYKLVTSKLGVAQGEP